MSKKVLQRVRKSPGCGIDEVYLNARLEQGRSGVSRHEARPKWRIGDVIEVNRGRFTGMLKQDDAHGCPCLRRTASFSQGNSQRPGSGKTPSAHGEDHPRVAD